MFFAEWFQLNDVVITVCKLTTDCCVGDVFAEWFVEFMYLVFTRMPAELPQAIQVFAVVLM